MSSPSNFWYLVATYLLSQHNAVKEAHMPKRVLLVPRGDAADQEKFGQAQVDLFPDRHLNS